ncbi:MAG: TonB family protein [Methylovulum miyakonense]|uniref:energy transducer TonB n=1 Tax=Methylovulum miyakonense TaxID=645578 RepID=UPI003BB5C147
MAPVAYWQKPFSQTTHPSGQPTVYEARQPFLSPAFVVSIVLHGAALAIWNTSPFPGQPPSLNGATAINSITVALTPSPSRTPPQLAIAQQQSQHQLPISEKRPTPQNTVSKRPQATVSVRKGTGTPKTGRQKTLKSIAKPPGMAPETSLKHWVSQRIDMQKNAAAPNLPYLPNTGATAPSQRFQQPLTKPKANGRAATENSQPPSTPRPIHPNITDNLPANPSLLPPLLKSRQPDYPEEARWEERTGKVTLKFKITDKGHVIDPGITTSSGHRDLDLAALQAIQNWRFEPKKGLGSQWFFYSFRFELH